MNVASRVSVLLGMVATRVGGLGLLIGLAAVSQAGFEYELTQIWRPKHSKLTAAQEAEERVQREVKSKSLSPSEVSSIRALYLGDEEAARKLAASKGTLRISAGDWGSELVFPVMNLSGHTGTPFYERYDGKSTATYNESGRMWTINPSDTRGYGGRFMDLYLRTGYLDSLTHRVESSRLPDGKWQDKYERKVPLKDPSTHTDERFTLVWSDERRSRLLSASNETNVARNVNFWRKGSTYRIVRPSPAGSDRMFDEAIATRSFLERPIEEHYVFKKTVPDPTLPYELLHDTEKGTLITENGAPGSTPLNYSYEGYRADPDDRAKRKRLAVWIGLGSIGLLTVFVGFFIARGGLRFGSIER